MLTEKTEWHYMFSFMRNIQNRQTHTDGKQMSLQGMGMEVAANGYGSSLSDKEEVLILDYGYGCIAL